MGKKLNVSLLIFCLALGISQSDAKLTKEAHDLYQQACSYEYKSDYNTAISIINKALAINGDDAMLYTKIAGLYADAGNYKEALSAYKKAVRLRPNDAFIYISMGNILQTLGDYDNAYNAFKHAQTIYPEYKYNCLNIANIEYFRKNYNSAIENYNIFLNAYPNNLEASENLANVYALSNQFDKACDIYAGIYKKYPSAFTEFEKYGAALYETKQFQAASVMLEKALADDENSETINAKLALTYQKLGENEKSLKYFNKTFEINPNLTALRFDYANLLGNMNKASEAIEQYKVYLKTFPNDADAYRNLGIVYKNINEVELALFNLEKSYTLDPSSNLTKKELALCYHSKKDYVNALKYYDYALKSEPENIELMANKALTLHAMDNYVSAIELYKEILDKKPNERIEQNLTAASIAYGYDLYEKKDYGQAILYFEDAIDLNPKEASAYFGYAMANEKMGCIDTAIENYRHAVSLAPGNMEYLSKLNSLVKSESTEANKTVVTQDTVQPSEVNIITPVVSAEEPMSYAVLLARGEECYKKQDYESAVDYYTKAVVYKPSDKILMQKIANIYKLMGNNAKAISFYDKIISIDSENSNAYFNKGLVYAGMKDYDNCIQCFEKVIQLTPEYPYAYYSLGMAYEQKGMKDKALEYYYLYSGLETDAGVLSVVEQKIKKLEAN